MPYIATDCFNFNQDDEPETITLEADELGKVRARNQVVDYMFRGDCLANYNIIEFFVDTYEGRLTNSDWSHQEKPTLLYSTI